MIKNFRQFESQDTSINIEDVMTDVKNEFNEQFINLYIMEHYSEYCDDEEAEEAGYDDQATYYKEEGAGGNGIEYDLINEIWEYIAEKHNINLSENKYEDLKYMIDYYIKEFFPHFYFVDYRKETDVQKMMRSFDKYDL